MLTLWRRHRSQCPHKSDRYFRKCKCACWIEGTLEGKYVRHSLKTRSWERATQLIRDLEDGKHEKQQIALKDALDAFIRDCESRNLNHSTLRKYRTLQSRLLAFAQDRGLNRCADLTADSLRDFRNSWNLSPRTSVKALERLRSFFKFCVNSGWLQTNPAASLKPPVVRPNPTLPFSDSECNKIFAETTDERARVFFRLLLASGLRIVDAGQLRPEKIVNGRLFLYSQKTGVPVYLPLPPDLLDDLQKLPLRGGFFFAVDSDYPPSIAEYYRKKLIEAGIKAGLMEKRKRKPGDPKGKNAVHPHRFRDTFATRLLMQGVDVADVATLLGNTVSIVQRHYAPWVAARQERLEAIVKQTWEAKPKLLRVK